MKGETQLLRQINPSFVQQGRVSSQAFKPTEKDSHKLSVYDGDRISSEAAWKHFTEKLRYSSIGVMAVTVDECAAHGLPVKPDPKPFPEHAFIDFMGNTRAQIEQKAKRLRDYASDRGWLFRSGDLQ